MRSQDLSMGERLRYARKINHMTQEQLAEQICVSRTTITNIENDRQNMTIETLRNMCIILNISCDWLVGMR